MSFMWKDFHDVGIHLDTFSEEAYKRSAIGRYYYACFNLTKIYFEREHFIIGHNQNPHEIIIKYLEYYEIEKEVELSKLLNNLRKYRNNADYDFNFRKNNIKKAKKTAEEIFLLLDELNNS